MHRENRFHILMRFQNAFQRAVYMTHGLAQILTAMRGHQNQTASACEHLIEIFISKMIIGTHGSLQSVDNRIAGYQNIFRHNIFLQKVSLARRGWRKMHIRNSASQLAVHFLRIGGIFIARTQPCLHMSHRNLRIEGCQRPRKGSRSIAMHQNHIGLGFLHNRLQAHQRTGGNIVQRLAAGHNIQVVVRLNAEKLQHLVQHFAMLGGNSHNGLNIFGIFAHLQYQRTHFNRFRAGTENSHQFKFFHGSSSPFTCRSEYRFF